MAKRYGLGNYNKPVHIIFTHDKNGKKIAYRYHSGCFRKFRISLDEAKLLEATNEAESITYIK